MPAEQTGYRFDIFISYRRSGSGTAAEWVHNHFHPLLRDCLADELDRDPQLFIDVDVEAGGYWPGILADAVLHSQLLVAVWSPPYFRSAWCLAEFESMLARERVLGLATDRQPQGLVYPVVFADGCHFPEVARNRQARNLKEWARPRPAFRETRDYDLFFAEMRGIAAELSRLLRQAPAWAPGWPVCRPGPIAPPDLELPTV